MGKTAAGLAHSLPVLLVTGASVGAHGGASHQPPTPTDCAPIAPAWSLPGPADEWYP